MYLAPKKIETKTVTEVQERVRVLTKITERPDGSKVTIIDSRKDTDSKEVSQTKPAIKDWQVGLTASYPKSNGDTVYSLNVQRSLFMSLYGGIYARTDKEFGLALSFSF